MDDNRDGEWDLGDASCATNYFNSESSFEIIPHYDANGFGINEYPHLIYDYEHGFRSSSENTHPPGKVACMRYASVGEGKSGIPLYNRYTYRWDVSKIEDRFGNEVNFFYDDVQDVA